jgi:nuclear transport factor 2 (NTF2) superfamily protein
MKNLDFKNWLKLYGQAWEDKDSRKFSALFTEDAGYYWTPFESMKQGREEIEKAFKEAVSTQSEIRFGYEVLSIENNAGICRWWCKFIRTTSGNLIKLDGIFLCEFDRKKLCKTFREWWHKEGE